ncbi:MAG: polymorphic toxin type 50 domain-containing protein, partial [Chlamydiia bacterium]
LVQQYLLRQAAAAENRNEWLSVHELQSLIDVRLEDLRRERDRYAGVQSILDAGWEYISAASLQYYQLERKEWTPRAQFERALLFFDYGRSDEVIKALEQLIDSGLAEDVVGQNRVGTPDFYSTLSAAHSECGEFGEAVLCLNKAIELAPHQKKLYLDRAMAYFETGSLDASLADYLEYGGQANAGALIDLPEVAEFGSGIARGIVQGASGEVEDFVPSLLSSAYGLSEGLWALVSAPIKTSSEFCQAASACIEMARECSAEELAQVFVPELAELVSIWETLSVDERGYRTGTIIGKYGVDIFAGAACLRGVKAYRELKQANAILTLETVAGGKGAQRAALIASQERYAARRRLYIEQLRLEPDKQGKHIVGHKYYVSDGAVARSVWTDPDPEGLIRLHAGTGRHIRGAFGSPGHKEIVDCGRIIGFQVDSNTKARLPTTMAQIHYSKNGAHIVPSAPKSQ